MSRKKMIKEASNREDDTITGIWGKIKPETLVNFDAVKELAMNLKSKLKLEK